MKLTRVINLVLPTAEGDEPVANDVVYRLDFKHSTWRYCYSHMMIEGDGDCVAYCCLLPGA